MTAAGLAVPAIEAWLLCGIDPQASEAAWNVFREGRADPGRIRQWKLNQKRKLYGAEPTATAHQKERALDAARQLISKLGSVRDHFPNGFGALQSDLERW